MNNESNILNFNKSDFEKADAYEYKLQENFSDCLNYDSISSNNASVCKNYISALEKEWASKEEDEAWEDL